MWRATLSPRLIAHYYPAVMSILIAEDNMAQRHYLREILEKEFPTHLPVFEAGDGDITEFFGVTESAHQVPNENRIAFWAESNERVDRLAEVARNAGARNMEGPMPYEPGYYAVFFEDPWGNPLEICHRVKASSS
jgi:catechol 2,3-dioxygenase-like lactoylglutathione lyase family enzyme